MSTRSTEYAKQIKAIENEICLIKNKKMSDDHKLALIRKQNKKLSILNNKINNTIALVNKKNINNTNLIVQIKHLISLNEKVIEEQLNQESINKKFKLLNMENDIGKYSQSSIFRNKNINIIPQFKCSGGLPS